MRLGFLQTLKFQISSALLLLLVLFAGAISYTLYGIEQRRNDNVILNLAGKLQITAQHLAMQALGYKENAPRDYSTYYRDVRLYYQDLMAHMVTFDQVTEAFMNGDFPPALTGMKETIHPMLDDGTRLAVKKLKTTWDIYHQELMDALGDDPKEPRLEYAAEYAVENQDLLQGASDRFLAEYQRLVRTHFEQINFINRVVLMLAFVIAAAIIAWFYLKVLRPLGRAVAGFQKVAQGDFGHQVAITGNNEIAWLSEGFNHLSRRLHAIFRLIDRIQGGSDLDSTLHFVSEDFGAFLPIDWIGALFLVADGATLQLERAYTGGQAEIAERKHFRLQGTLLAQAMVAGDPLHVPDLSAIAEQNPDTEFLRLLAGKGMHSAIFLPLTEQSAVPGVLVFATRERDAYHPEHLELLTNIAHLVTHSFGKTVKLVEQARLAAIGEFASSIAHEIRNPLATISLALDYFKKIDLPEAARKRADLATSEAGRMERLLEDILLYAKPLSLNLIPLDLNERVAEMLEINRTLAELHKQRFRLQRADEPREVMGDPDRLTQVFLNLARNACEAAPEGSSIRWKVANDRAEQTVTVSVHNDGEPIPADVLPRLLTPFFTTKTQGTGLGLSIVKRIVEAHGGEFMLESSAEGGTTAAVTLPAVVTTPAR